MVLALSDPGAPATFSEFFKRLRRTSGLSLGEIARISGVAKSTLSRWEAGLAEPDVPTLEAALGAFNSGRDLRIRGRALIKAPRGGAEPAPLKVFTENDVALPGSGDLLQALRMRKGLSAQEAARALGVSAPSLSRWETGARSPDFEFLSRAADLFGASTEDRSLLFRPSARHSAPPSYDELAEGVHGLSVQLRDGDFGAAELGAIMLQRQGMRLAEHDDRAVALVSRALALRALTLGEQGRMKQSSDLAWQAIDLQPTGPLATSPSTAVIIWSLFEGGGPQRARRALEFALDIAERSEGAVLIENYVLQLRLWGELKLRAELERTFDVARRLATALDPDMALPQIQNAFCDGLLALGDVDAARAMLTAEDPGVLARPMHQNLIVAEALIRTGDRAEGEPHLAAALEFAQARGLRNYDLDRVRAIYDESNG